jgi:alpha-glucosidase
MIALLGTPQRLPHFCFGYQQSRWSFFNAAEVHAAVQRFHENNVPLDSVYFDIDYMDHYRVFTVDKTAFHDLPGLISELHAQGIHSVSILDPGIKIDPGYAAFEELVQSDGALKTSQGEPFAAEAWAGASLLPDFYSARVQAWWRDKVSAWIRETNLDGIWNDMNEPTNWRGKNDTTAETVSAEGPMFERFNHYGLHMAAASDSGLHAAHPDRRHLNITRSGYPGVQQHAVIWHGDNAAWWEHMQMAVDMAVSYSLAGAFYTGPDVPGFAQNATDDLAVRFYQLGAFLPFFRGHRHLLSKPNEPFDFSPEANDLIKSAIHLRYSLLREWITGFEMAIQSGKSPLMPVFSPDNNLVRDQFMLFDTFLVCPVLARDQSARLIALPPGDWYRLGHPEERIAGGRYIVEPVSLSSVPVFVRAGKIITRNTVGRNAADTLDSPERYEVYPDAHGAAVGYWYDDDGRSSQFEPKRFFEIVVEGQRVQKKSSVIKSNP